MRCEFKREKRCKEKACSFFRGLRLCSEHYDYCKILNEEIHPRTRGRIRNKFDIEEEEKEEQRSFPKGTIFA